VSIAIDAACAHLGTDSGAHPASLGAPVQKCAPRRRRHGPRTLDRPATPLSQPSRCSGAASAPEQTSVRPNASRRFVQITRSSSARREGTHCAQSMPSAIPGEGAARCSLQRCRAWPETATPEAFAGPPCEDKPLLAPSPRTHDRFMRPDCLQPAAERWGLHLFRLRARGTAESVRSWYEAERGVTRALRRVKGCPSVRAVAASRTEVAATIRFCQAQTTASRRVVQSRTPCQAIPPGLACEFDVIEIRRTWHFDMAIRLY
jgi:hypothetical protein